MNLFVRSVIVGIALLLVVGVTGTAITSSGEYVGSKSCEECHEVEYGNFEKYAKKAHSYKSIEIMMSDLEPDEIEECYHCHTTGYGKPGGFVSVEKTPDLKNAGCEVCHGPGKDHVESGGDPELIIGQGQLSIEDCKTCHNEDRVANFDYKPLLYGGAH